MSLKNIRGEIDYPHYKHLEMFNDEDNYPSIASIPSLDKAIKRRDQDAVDAAYVAQDAEFTNEVERDVGRKTAEVAEATLKLCSIQEELPFASMPVTQDQAGNALKSVSNTLDPIAFADALVNDAAELMMKMSIGSTTADPPDVEDNFWGDKPWHVTVDLKDLEGAINIIEQEVGEVGATVGKVKGVLPDHLSKI